MAEWLSTDIFQTRVSPASRNSKDARSRLREVNALLADRACHIKNSNHGGNKSESSSKKDFDDEEFTHKINLENHNRCESKNQPYADLCLFYDSSNVVF